MRGAFWRSKTIKKKNSIFKLFIRAASPGDMCAASRYTYMKVKFKKPRITTSLFGFYRYEAGVKKTDKYICWLYAALCAAFMKKKKKKRFINLLEEVLNIRCVCAHMWGVNPLNFCNHFFSFARCIRIIIIIILISMMRTGGIPPEGDCNAALFVCACCICARFR